MTRARPFAFCVAAVATLSVLLRLWLNLPDLGLWGAVWGMARYFTILTSLIVVAVFARVAFGRAPQPALIAGTTLWMVMVGLIYHALLGQDLSGAEWVADQGLHSVTPIAAALWWLVYGPKRGLGWADAAWWTLWPMAYLVYALLRGLAEGTYPYFFIDPTLVGWSGLLIWVIALWGVFWGSGLAVVALASWGRRKGAGSE